MSKPKSSNRNIVSFYLNNSEFEQLKILAKLDNLSVHSYVKKLVYTRINKVDLTKGPSNKAIRAQQELLKNYLIALLEIQELASAILEDEKIDEGCHNRTRMP
jgi:hypothetical protein